MPLTPWLLRYWNPDILIDTRKPSSPATFSTVHWPTDNSLHWVSQAPAVPLLLYSLLSLGKEVFWKTFKKTWLVNRLSDMMKYVCSNTANFPRCSTPLLKTSPRQSQQLPTLFTRGNHHAYTLKSHQQLHGYSLRQDILNHRGAISMKSPLSSLTFHAHWSNSLMATLTCAPLITASAHLAGPVTLPVKKWPLPIAEIVSSRPHYAETW